MPKLSSQKNTVPVFCDEAGFTGPNLLDPVQRVFSFASVAVGDEEAWPILKAAQEKFPVQMPELKAAKLLKSKTGRQLVLDVLHGIDGRYSFVLQDKLLVLCGKVFEYIYEPVFQRHIGTLELFYHKNLHRFLAMYCYVFFNGDDGKSRGKESIQQFENFMRSLDPTEAPLLFRSKVENSLLEGDPFEIILKFATGYRDVIVSDNQRMKKETNDQGKWALDVSVAGLWSMLNHWGKAGKKLAVVCDDSKPLRDQAWGIIGGDNDPGIRRAIEMGGDPEEFGFELSDAIQFGDSRNHPALQIADLVAGAAKCCLHDSDDPQLEDIRNLMRNHIHKHTIMPDFDYVALGTREVDVNWLVLMELGQRANNGQDPVEGLPEFYKSAEATWTPQRLG